MKMRRDEAIETWRLIGRNCSQSGPMKMRRDEAIETYWIALVWLVERSPMKMRRDEAIETKPWRLSLQICPAPYEDAP